MSREHDVILLGQGLAGTVLHRTLRARGMRVLMVDAPRAGMASHVAAGMVNPVVLRRMVLSWRASEMLAIANAFYREMELDHDAAFWHPTRFAKIFSTAKEKAIWQLRAADEVGQFLIDEQLNDSALSALPQPFGHGQIMRACWLDVQKMLKAERQRMRDRGELLERTVGADEPRIDAHGVSIAEHKAPLLVRCMGSFGHVPGLAPVRGEGLTVRIPGLRLSCIVHHGVFLLPVGEEVYRVGATYAWDDIWKGPSEEAREYLLARLGHLVGNEVEVLDHWAGVRPASKDRRPILGRTGAYEAVFNGLGSRGVLLAPWCAQHLAAHLFDGSALDPEVDASRFA